MQHEEQDLRIACRGRIRIERLQFAHRAQAHRRGRVIEAEHIGGEVQSDQADRRMPAWYLRHQSRKQRPERAREQIDQAGLFGDT